MPNCFWTGYTVLKWVKIWNNHTVKTKVFHKHLLGCYNCCYCEAPLGVFSFTLRGVMKFPIGCSITPLSFRLAEKWATSLTIYTNINNTPYDNTTFWWYFWWFLRYYDMNNKLVLTYWLLDLLTYIQITFCIYSLFFNVTVFIVGLHFLLDKIPMGW